MRLAILHYHLQAGGVNRIIDLAAKALAEAGHEVAVIAGSAPHARSLLDRGRVGVVPDLNYAQRGGDVAALGRKVDAAARRVLGKAPDLWHIHNPTLGKNPMVPILAARWASEGRVLVMQLHDFAEQGRPANYRILLEAAASEGRSLREFLYPVHAGVRYAVLTSHAAAVLAAAGLEPGAFVLPNPVQELPMDAPFPSSAIGAEEYLVYPTRAIIRKNLGEALLWAAFMKPGRKLVVTLAPEDPASRAEHDLWEEFAARRGLPVIFDSVTRFGRPLGDFVAGSRASITTSIREGFGMAYLEPWLLGSPVVGRDLPEVTADFHAGGIAFDWLYSSIPVDLTAEERGIYTRMTRAIREESASVYGVNPSGVESGRGWERPDGPVDFGFLPSPLQRSVLERGLGNAFAGISLPDLQIDTAALHAAPLRRILNESFGLESYGRRLERVYEITLSGEGDVSGESAFLNPDAVLSQFLKAG